MVKILENKVKEKSPEIKRCEDLFAYTKKLLGEEMVRTDPVLMDRDFKVPICWSINMARKEGGIMVLPLNWEVSVYDAGHYDGALKLAEAYEQLTREEWTLRKDYR